MIGLWLKVDSVPTSCACVHYMYCGIQHCVVSSTTHGGTFDCIQQSSMVSITCGGIRYCLARYPSHMVVSSTVWQSWAIISILLYFVIVSFTIFDYCLNNNIFGAIYQANEYCRGDFTPNPLNQPITWSIPLSTRRVNNSACSHYKCAYILEIIVGSMNIISLYRDIIHNIIIVAKKSILPTSTAQYSIHYTRWYPVQYPLHMVVSSTVSTTHDPVLYGTAYICTTNTSLVL